MLHTVCVDVCSLGNHLTEVSSVAAHFCASRCADDVRPWFFAFLNHSTPASRHHGLSRNLTFCPGYSGGKSSFLALRS